MRKSKFKDGDRMDCKEIREMYKLMFAEYPDIVTVKDLQAMLGISRHAAYYNIPYDITTSRLDFSVWKRMKNLAR